MNRKEQMQEMYDDGLSICNIAEEFGISRQRVSQILGPLGERAHYGRAKKERRISLLREMHSHIVAGSITREEAAERLGISPNSLYEAMKSVGLSLPKKESPLHGTIYRYSKGCRCEACREAMRVTYRRRRERGPRVHGTSSSYSNFGCRCEACRRAGSIANREQRIRRVLREKERMLNE